MNTHSQAIREEVKQKMHKIAFGLLVIGGLNWLVQGAIGWEVGQLFGGMDAWISRVIYILVGLSAIYEIATHAKRCRECASRTTQNQPQAGSPQM